MAYFSRGLITVLALAVFALAPARAATPVKIGLAVPDVSDLLIYVAQEKGFFKAADLDIELVQFDSDASARIAILANAVQINSASIFPVIESYISGRDLRAIWSISNLPGYVWYGQPKFSSIKDLKGGRIGISSVGATTELITAWAISRAGMDPAKDVSFIALGGPLSRVAALKVGQVDAIPATAPGTFLLEQEGFKPLLDLKDLMPEFSYEQFFVRKAYLDSNIDTLRALMRATLVAKHWAMAHRDEAADILMKSLGADASQKDAYRKTVDLALPYYPEDGSFADDALNLFLGFYKQQGRLKEIPPLAAFIDYRLIDYFRQNPVKE